MISHFVCLSLGAIFGYILGAIMATGGDADIHNDKEDKPNE